MDIPKDKRERKPNFSDEEVMFLLEGINEEKVVIHSRLQSSLTVKKKKEAWGRIVAKVNAGASKVFRSEDDCRKKWRDLKSATVKQQADQRKTGSGGPMKDTPFKDVVLGIIGDDGNAIIHGIDGMLFIAFPHSQCTHSTLYISLIHSNFIV